MEVPPNILLRFDFDFIWFAKVYAIIGLLVFLQFGPRCFELYLFELISTVRFWLTSKVFFAGS